MQTSGSPRIQRTTSIRFRQAIMSEMKRLTKLFILTAVSVGTLTACGYQGGYRYECQDPKNWETPECKPPICTATQTCPIDLIKTPIVEGAPNE